MMLLLQPFFPAAARTCLRFYEPVGESLRSSLCSLKLHHTAHVLVENELKLHTTFWNHSELELPT